MEVELTQEQRVHLGTQAARILGDEALMGFISEMRADYLTCIGNTQPDDKTTRETLYYRVAGLTDLLATLTAYREAAEGILAADAEEQAAGPSDIESD